MATLTSVKAKTASAYSDASFDVAPGDTVCLTTDNAGGIPASDGVIFYYDNTDADSPAFTLSGNERIKTMAGYAKLIGKKGVTSVTVGIDKFSA